MLIPMTGRRAIPSGLDNTQVIFQSKINVSALTLQIIQSQQKATRQDEGRNIMMFWLNA